MSINADLTAVYIANKGFPSSFAESNAIHNQNGLVQLDGNEITSGKAVVINAHKLTTGTARDISGKQKILLVVI